MIRRIERGIVSIFDLVHFVDELDDKLCDEDKDDEEEELIISEERVEDEVAVRGRDMTRSFDSKEEGETSTCDG